MFGEEVIVDNADKALRIACDKTGAEITDYTAAPVYMSDDHQGAHEWLIEFSNLLLISIILPPCLIMR